MRTNGKQSLPKSRRPVKDAGIFPGYSCRGFRSGVNRATVPDKSRLQNGRSGREAVRWLGSRLRTDLPGHPNGPWGAASADGPECPGATGHPRGATDHFFQSRMITVSPDFSTTTFWRSFQPSSSIRAFGMVT